MESISRICNMLPKKLLKKIESLNRLLIIDTKIQKDIYSQIGWGLKTKKNIIEQGGLLIGNTYSENEKYISVVEAVIKSMPTYANGSFLEWGHDSWTRMLNNFDELYYDKNFKIIGWYHTHPNSLPVFMSETDRNTQKLYFNKKWHFSLVLNPHTKNYRCFNGKNSTDSSIEFVNIN